MDTFEIEAPDDHQPLFSTHYSASSRHHEDGGGMGRFLSRTNYSLFGQGEPSASDGGIVREYIQYAIAQIQQLSVPAKKMLGACLALLAIFVFWIGTIRGSKENNRPMMVTGDQHDNIPPPIPVAHSFSFGGLNNVNHNNRDKEPPPPPPPPDIVLEEQLQDVLEDEELEEEIEMDVSLRMGPWDVTLENKLNEQAHYLHDPYLSPFSSGIYTASEEELDKRQDAFSERMQRIKEEFGEWNNPPPRMSNPVDFDAYLYRDIPLEHFTGLNAWQRDKKYLAKFLDEADALIEAVKEGIMQEYGKPNGHEKQPFDVIIGTDNLEVLNGTAVNHFTLEPLPGVAYLSTPAWDGLVRKLLHAMITEDYFYVVVAGTMETYGANNFAQSQVMQFNYIMEPVLHKLGITLISRNMGMNASTAVSALGGADIYGETDILWHIQDEHTEERPGVFDLLHRQAIMSGERVPIILSSNTDELTLASKRSAWVGNIQPGIQMCHKTHMPVCQLCAPTHDQEHRCEHVYNSVCWEPRSDWNGVAQHNGVGMHDKGFPGYREHQLEGRKMTLLVLQGLHAAIDIWRQELLSSGEKSSLPLDPSLWHVGETYTAIRKSVMTLKDRKPGEAAGLTASCELLMKDLDPRICHVPMRAWTEWTPRVVPSDLRLSAIVNNLIEGMEDDDEDAYDGPDIVPLAWLVPDPYLDVHMIAIAANNTLVEDDDAFLDEMYWGGRRLEIADQHNGGPISRSRERPFSADDRKNADSAKRPAQTTVDPAESSSHSRRTMIIEEPEHVAAGSGWRLVGAPHGFCDGSAQSRCRRTSHNPCLLANFNHFKGSIMGTVKTGWLKFLVAGVHHGIVLARLEFGHMKLPDDFVFDLSVNGQVKSYKPEELSAWSTTIVDGLTVYPLVLESKFPSEKSPGLPDSYDVAIRIQSQQNPNSQVRISHVYFA